PDGKQLLVKKGVWLYVDVATGKTSAGPPVDGEYFAWAPGGAYRAYREPDGRIAVTDANWKVVRHTASRNFQGCPAPAGLGCCPAPKDIGCSSVQAVSPDGWYVAVGVTGTDPNHVTRTAAVLDSRAGRPIPLQVGTGEISKVIMSKDRGILMEKVTADGK